MMRLPIGYRPSPAGNPELLGGSNDLNGWPMLSQEKKWFDPEWIDQPEALNRPVGALPEEAVTFEGQGMSPMMQLAGDVVTGPNSWWRRKEYQTEQAAPMGGTRPGWTPQSGGRGPSAKDSAQTSMGGYENLSLAEKQALARKDAAAGTDFRMPLAQKQAAEAETLGSMKQSNQAWSNKWSAFAHQGGMDTNKALQAIKELSSQRMSVPGDNEIKYLLTLLKQKGLL